jgi:hypothetical protein
MKEPSTIRYFIFLFLGLSILTSCNEEDDNPPSETTFPVTLTFSGVTDTEFRMWTNGAEVNTDNLNVQDFMNIDDWAELSPEYFNQIGIALTFDQDSIYGINDFGENENYEYFFRNDSLFLDVELIFFEDTIQEVYFATGNLMELSLNKGYYELCIGSEFITTCQSQQNQAFFEITTIEEESETDSLIDFLDENDTLLIYNQRVLFN